MKSLFGKIFLWFWLTVFVSIAMTLAINLTIHKDDAFYRIRELGSGAIPVFATTMVDTYQRQGPRAAERYLRQISRQTPLVPELYDHTGRRIASGGTGTAPMSLIRRVLANRSEQYMPLPRVIWRVYPVTGEHGQRFAFAVSTRTFPGTSANPLLRMIVLVAVATLCCGLLARHIALPIRQLRTASTDLAAGKLETRVASLESRRDEIGALARDFNQMAERLEASAAAQKRLLADISHELRSPLARINIALGLGRRAETEAIKPCLDRIESDAERLNELIGQLSTLSVLEGGAKPTRTPVDLAALVRAITDDAAFEAASRGVKVTYSVSGEPVPVSGDAPLLRSAIENVVRNGVRHTARGTAVDVTLTFASPPSIAVRDHGPGVPPGELDAIFRPFHRVDTSRDRSLGGVGLGLAIAKSAIEAHGGAVTARNVDGGGLEVVMTLAV
jgi:two-component system sensor histidine kinase CpxA